ncbi:hypothetical protein L6452_10621 [Arctium lappa]|uniref:Uncharacterized protein n=1 Tax=Arctium lappa TaxID=4217 RepID=A0ACB9DMI1_ARCLA|nr:hypothetical protein L6452_10621 [Arctium lappa]
MGGCLVSFFCHFCLSENPTHTLNLTQPDTLGPPIKSSSVRTTTTAAAAALPPIPNLGFQTRGADFSHRSPRI